ncbi:MAG TPA: putative Fe-S cluster assembly protein SufT [Candidatus Limnocylindrales bacterium]|nr:putative Fe-S cluster assembly protein SufT [Candidatus Limnocylindrales bacterium]
MSHALEEVELRRDCEAIVIPHGYRTQLTQGTRVRLMQQLGGSVTVSAEFGGLFRIDPEEFDALGLEAPPAENGVIANQRPLEERVWDALRTCYDPEIPVDIVELGLVYDCRVLEPGDDGRHDVEVKMTLTAPGCGMGDVLTEDVRHKLEKLPDVGRARVEMVFDPPWNQDMMSDAARLHLGFF